MNRFFRVSTFTLLATLLPAMTNPAAADPTPPAGPNPRSDAAVEPAAALPLTEITLFSSGVGHFRHAGPVPAGGEVTLSFTADELNDVLKSLTLNGAGGGAAVTYAGVADLDERLGGFGVDLRGVSSRYDLLTRLRGVRVRLTPQAGGAPVEGRVLGVETRPRTGEDGEKTDERFVTLAADGFLAELNLQQVERLEVRDERLAAEMAQAMELLAGTRDTRKKAVTVRFRDAAERVGLSYLTASPLWKLSYRLELDGGAGAEGVTAKLQGWAVVDNTSDRDWNGVRVTLVSGRPVSFVQDLYTPEYLTRPTVIAERYAGLRPQSYGQTLDTAEVMEPGSMLLKQRSLSARRGFAGAAEAELAAAAPMAGAADAVFGAGSDVNAAAAAGDLGDLFAYTLDEPVSLGRGQSAMLPVVQEAIDATPVSVFNDSVQATHPMRGVRLTNTTDLKLDAGPVTVLRGGAYAGDARLGFLAPGADRLLTYALDLEVTVDADDRRRNVRTGGRFSRGLLVIEQREEASRTWTVKNAADEGRDLLVETDKLRGWDLANAPDDTEDAGDRYRLPLTVGAGETAKLRTLQTRTLEQQVELTRLDEAGLLQQARGGALPDDVVASLREAAELRAAVADAERALAENAAARKEIGDEQGRLRKNMQSLGRDSALYKRYLEKLNTQEDELERLDAAGEAVRSDRNAARERFEGFVGGLG